MHVAGYKQSRLEALNETHACIVGEIPYSNTITPSLDCKIWLFINGDSVFEAAFGCGSGYLMDYNLWAPYILGVQDLRVNGPWYLNM